MHLTHDEQQSCSWVATRQATTGGTTQMFQLLIAYTTITSPSLRERA
jgi:hypothetical protein